MLYQWKIVDSQQKKTCVKQGQTRKWSSRLWTLPIPTRKKRELLDGFTVSCCWWPNQLQHNRAQSTSVSFSTRSSPSSGSMKSPSRLSNEFSGILKSSPHVSQRVQHSFSNRNNNQRETTTKVWKFPYMQMSWSRRRWPWLDINSWKRLDVFAIKAKTCCPSPSASGGL